MCIGAGVIGLEIASSARARGCSVSVVDIAETVMSRTLDARHAALVEDLHRRNGVEFFLSNAVEEIGPDFVQLSSGSRLPADVVIVGVGIERNIELARRAGIASLRGIQTDESGFTGTERVYAAGEVAEFYSTRLSAHTVLETWRHAQDHGTLVGRTAAGAIGTYDEVLWFWSDQCGVNLQFAGDTTGKHSHKTIDRGEPDTSSFATFYLDASDRVVGAIGYNAAKEVAAALRLLRRNLAVPPERLSDRAVPLNRIVSEAALGEVREAAGQEGSLTQ